jgi:UrcA family protein
VNTHSKGSGSARPLQVATLVVLGSVAAVTVSAAGTPADNPNDDRVTVKVGYADLNLVTQAGKDTLKRRIRRAAHLACGSPDARDPLVSTEYRHCMTSATNNAWSQVKWPQS